MNASPYPGLRPFRRDETDIFFGREEQTDQILDKLGQSRFLAVVGTSGCGKSSLLRAGVIAALETGFLATAGARWQIAEMRPGNRPLGRLAEAFLRESPLGLEDIAKADALPFLQASIRRGPLGLLEALGETPLAEHTNLLLLVDQFEEIFRYRQGGDRDEADAFVALLLATAQQTEAPVYVIIAMRSDFLGDCALFNGLPEAMNESQFLTPRLTREQRHAAIVGPARVFGGEVEPALVSRLLNDMGSDSDQLPLMQHLLMRMWRRANGALQRHSAEPGDAVPWVGKGEKGIGSILTLADYQPVGGLANALSNHADEALKELDNQQQRIAEVLFRCLSERGPERRDTRRPVRLKEVALVAGVSPEQVTAVVEVFRHPDRSFVIPPAETPLSPESFLDISHESLIRRWQKMSQWVEREGAAAATYRRLEETALLWQEKKADPWGPLDLENAMAVWEDSGRPTTAWAKRYGGHFELAMEFLEASEQKRKADLQREEEARQRELKQARRRLQWVSVGLLLVLLVAGWAIWERYRAEREKSAAVVAKREAVQARDIAQVATNTAKKERNSAREIAARLFESQVDLLSRLARTEDYATAYGNLAQMRDSDQAIAGQRRHARNLLEWFINLMGGPAPSAFMVPDVSFKKVAISPDGMLLAAFGKKGAVALFDARSGELLKYWQGHEGDVNTAVFHPQGQWLASGGDDGSIAFWTLPKAEKLRSWSAPGKVWALAISPDSKILASGGDDKNITLWEAETGKRLLPPLKGHRNSIYALAFNRDSLLASASFDYTARIWDTKTRKQISYLDGDSGRMYGVAFSPDGQFLATSSENNSVHLWQVKEGRLLREFKGHQHKVFGLVFVENGRRLVSSSFDRTVRVWDTDSGVTLRVLQGHTGAVTGVTADASLFSVSNDGWRRWDQHLERNQRDIQLIDLPDDPVSTALAPDGSSVVVGFTSGALRLYTLPDVHLQWEQAHAPHAHTERVNRLAFSPDGRHVASASLDRTVKLWHVDDGQYQQTLRGHKKGINAVAFHGNFLASVDDDGQIGLFELHTGQGRFHQAHKGKALSVGFDISGRSLLSTGEDGETSLWNRDTWPPVLLRGLHKSEEWVMWAAFDPDGRCIASVGEDKVLRILKSHDDCKERELAGHEGRINRAAFGPKGDQVATVSSDGTVRLWDLTIGTELFALRLPTELFALRLPKESYLAGPLDFDFRCTRQETGGNCWISVPLSRRRLVLYHLDRIYD